VFSTRLDSQTVDELNRLTRRLGISKKQFLEEAIRLRVSRAGEGAAADVWEETCGAWKRSESPRTTIRRVRRAFEASMQRHCRSKSRS
jgi:hypothetical protein